MLQRKKKRMVDWDSVDKSNYENKAFWDIHWVRSARTLFVSAKELEPKVLELWENYRAHLKDRSVKLKPDHYFGPYFMLVAFAVENYFKAAIVRENSWDFKEDFRDKPKFPKDLDNHDLILLAKKAGFDFSKEEEGLLRRLTRHAVWAGRYPIPTYYKKSAPGEQFSDGKEYAVSYYAGEDVERLNLLIARIEEKLGFVTA
jgi:hypothetical protein